MTVYLPLLIYLIGDGHSLNIDTRKSSEEILGVLMSLFTEL